MAKATASYYVFLRVGVAIPAEGIVPDQEGVERWVREQLVASTALGETPGGWFIDTAETFDPMGEPRGKDRRQP